MAAPDAQYTLHLPDGRRFGPAPLSLIEQWAREGRVPPDAQLVGADGAKTPVLDEPILAAVVQAPPTVAPEGLRPIRAGEDDDARPGPGLIPVRNLPALIGYYIGIFSLIPFLGLLLAPVALILGIIGLVKVRRRPAVRGTAHAIVAIVLAFGSVLLSVGLIVLIDRMNW